MRILVTNDDGINAPGLEVLEAIAHEIAGPTGEVWVVAPAFEQSGVGHKISYTSPFLITKVSDRRYATEAAPADCVLAGLYQVMTDFKPDLILSGINRGNNAGENVLYSGTLGAALEGALQGVPSIALSQYIGPDNRDADVMFNAAAAHGAATVQKLLDHGIWDQEDYRVFYNVNFPALADPDAVKGLRVGAQGFRRNTNFKTEATLAPNKRTYLWITGGGQHEPTLPGTDVTDCLDGYISVVPLRADLTAHDHLAALKERLE